MALRIRSPSLQLTLHEDVEQPTCWKWITAPLPPAGPAGPCGPGGPCGPAGPCGPGGPCSPFSPDPGF